VLEDGRYRDSAQWLKNAFRKVDGLNRAADVIEKALGIGAERRESVAAD
jgi:UDP:flavonoid glycosyltransferase YjiC (YdhE family)